MVVKDEGRARVIIEKVAPEIDSGLFPVKRAVGESVVVSADIFADGHDAISAVLRYRGPSDGDWREVPMRHISNDRWQGSFTVDRLGTWQFTVQGWVDRFGTWQRDLRKKYDAGVDISVDLLIGADLLEEHREQAGKGDKGKFKRIIETIRKGVRGNADDAVSAALGDEAARLSRENSSRAYAVTYLRTVSVVVEPAKVLFSTWYELFPRSCPGTQGHGTFKECEKLIPEIGRMGFDVIYFPPIHPIGISKRKGKNNVPAAGLDDVGSPWAIGSDAGGHTAIHPDLGSFDDFDSFIRHAKEHGIDVAIDLAFQCSPDHPYVKQHPEWFRHRPDGTIQYAENPPKKYEDIYPFDFESSDWKGLWEELRNVVRFWLDKGIRIFRVDNPHTKSFPFWEWLIADIRKTDPDVIFLSEAFTRPKVMYRLAKIGFTQSYTYFTWRYTQREFREYLAELTKTEVRDFFRPNFWPNTPDILPEHLQYGGRPAFIMRLILAATLSSNYGIYGPAFELCEGRALPGREEYDASEKYEIKQWEWDRPDNLRDLIARINTIRRENPALQTTFNLEFFDVDNDQMLCYCKASEDLSNILVVVVNLDPFRTQAGWITIPVERFGLGPNQPYLVHDLIGDDRYIWEGERNHVTLDPHIMPAVIFRIRRRLKRESDFDYFM